MSLALRLNQSSLIFRKALTTPQVYNGLRYEATAAGKQQFQYKTGRTIWQKLADNRLQHLKNKQKLLATDTNEVIWMKTPTLKAFMVVIVLGVAYSTTKALYGFYSFLHQKYNKS